MASEAARATGYANAIRCVHVILKNQSALVIPKKLTVRATLKDIVLATQCNAITVRAILNIAPTASVT
jgi:hypothetical protein